VRDGPECSNLGRGSARTWVLACLAVLVLAALAWGQAGQGSPRRTLIGGADEVEGLEQVDRGGPGPIERFQQFWQQYGKFFIWGAACLLLVAAVWIVKPFRFFDAASDRLLKRSLRRVDDLLKRIQEEAEAASENSKKEESTAAEEGLLAGLAEVAEFSNAEQVPSYVLTVNDLMLDNIRLTLKRLRRFTEGNAERYREYMFSVLQGIKTLTEQSAEGGVASGLAVDIHDYFADDKRYQAWRKLLSRAAKRGRHQEVAHGFLLFMRDVREGRPVGGRVPTGGIPPVGVLAKQAPASVPEIAIAAAEETPAIPRIVNEETLPAIQQAAAHEAQGFCSFVETGKSPDGASAWQFELVRRQRQIPLKDEARRMLAVFLSHERKTLREITKVRMLPCRTWEHILRLLGVESETQLDKRVEDRLLTTQEILILEKAFLQTFAKRESLERIYGRDKDAGLMMDLHVPQIRREALALLRKLRQAEPEPLEDATQALNDEETPQNGQVKRLIEHYVHHRHDPPR
jgi:hypothetical protein